MLCLTLFVILLKFFSVLACPRSCTCSEKVKLVNCANGGFTHLPRGVRGNGHYIILLMNDNQITTLTEKDMTELQGFKEIDMRNNPLNCTSIHPDILKVILSDCNLKETPSQHSYLTIRTRETLPVTTRVHDVKKVNKAHTTPLLGTRAHNGKNEGNLMWLIVLPILVVLGVCAFILTRKMRQRHRVIRAIPMEMTTLRKAEDEDEEVILFELKEKQC